MVARLRSLALLFAAAPLMPALALDGGERALFVEGKAFDKRSGEWVYSEAHYCNAAQDACRVTYTTPSGELIVEKVVDFSSNTSAPNFKQFDLRNEKLVAAAVDGDSARFARAALPRDSWQGFETTLPAFDGAIDASDQLVIDAGFDNYVRTRWRDLASGAKVRFDFALPSRAASLPMVARRKPAGVCDAVRESVALDAAPPTVAEDLCLEIAPANWLLNSFVSPIRLEYDADNRRLLSFAGMSNIPNEQGKAYRVYIVYDYPGPDARLTGAWHGKDTGWNQ